MLIDTHAHLTFPDYKNDLTEALARAKEVGLEAIINVALDDASANQSLKLGKENELIYTAVGIHPHDASEWKNDTEIKIRSWSKNKKVVAIGETGLDYHYDLSPRAVQQEVFRKHLRLAQELDLPVIIHAREAGPDCLNIIHEENQGNLKGVFHCFAGSIEMADKILDLGFLISFTGIITFKKANQAREVAKHVPLESIMLETDCPFLAPQTVRGKRNEPAYLPEIAQKLAEIRGKKLEEIAIATTENAKKLFRL